MAEHQRVVLITGAGSGIGAAVARRFAKEGFAVVLAGRRAGALQAVARDCGEATLCVPTDVSEYGALERLVRATSERFGRLDVLVNNAGVAYGGTLEDMEASEIEYAIRVNLTAPFWLARLALPLLRQSPAGRIVNIASLSGIMKMPHQSVYVATKAGLIAAGTSLARELERTPIKVCTVIPGSVETETLPPALVAQAQSLKLPVHAMKAERAAELIVPAVLRGRATIYVTSAQERAGATLQRWAPWVVDRISARIADSFRVVALEGTRYLRTRHGRDDARKP